MTNIPKTDDQVDQWRSVMFLYDSALKRVNTKIEILNNEFTNRYDYNPIEHIKSRLKTADSIVKKLKKDGYEVTIENMMERGHPHYLFLYLGYLPDCRYDCKPGGCDGSSCEGLYQVPQAERV